MNFRDVPQELFNKFTKEGQLEFTILAGIDNLLTRVTDVKGDECFVYVRGKEYLNARLGDLIRKEQHFMKVQEDAKKVAEDLKARAIPVAPVAEVPKPALSLVNPTEEPKKTE